MAAYKYKNKGTNPDGSKRPKLGNATVFDSAHISIECIVEGGTFHGGTFYGGTFYSGIFYGGIFNGGIFYGGIFKGGTFNDGDFNGGTFDGGVFNNTSDTLQFFALGDRVGWTTAYVVDGVVMVSAGCFYGTLAEFKKAVKNGNARQRKNYSAVIPLMKGLLK